MSKRKLVFGVGIFDGESVGVKSSENGKPTKPYMAWMGMLGRCYSPDYQASNTTYIGCSVCPEWLTFSGFYHWWLDNYVEGHHLDKDLLIPANKVYSPATCVYVPRQLNMMLNARAAARGDWPLGVYRNGNIDKFRASIGINGKCRRIGQFDSAMLAHQAWMRAKQAQLREAFGYQTDVRIMSALNMRDHYLESCLRFGTECTDLSDAMFSG